MRTVLSITAVLISTTATLAATPMTDCRSTDWTRAIKGCSRVIVNRRASKKRRSFAHVLRGRAYANRREYGRAAREFQSALRLDPRNADAYGLRASMRISRGRLKAALADLNRALRLAPNYVGAFVNRGLVRARQRDYGRAITDFDRALRLRPANAHALASRGHVRRLQGKFDQAIEDLTKAIAASPSYVFALSERIDAYMVKGDVERALADCDRLLELRPQDQHTIKRRQALLQINSDPRYSAPAPHPETSVGGPSERGSDRVSKPIKPSRQAGNHVVKAAPTPPPMRVGKAARLKSRRDTVSQNKLRARRARTTSAGRAKNVRELVAIGEQHLQNGELEAAYKTGMRLIEGAPTLPFGFVVRGIVYARRGDVGRAMADFDRSIKLDPGYVVAHLERGRALLAAGRPAQAAAACAKAIWINARLPAAYNCRGVAHLRRHQRDSAMADFDKALALDPNFVLALQNKGVVLALAGDHLTAIETFSSALAIKANSDSYALRGRSYAARGDALRAKRDYDRALAINRKHQMAQVGLQALLAAAAMARSMQQQRAI